MQSEHRAPQHMSDGNEFQFPAAPASRPAALAARRHEWVPWFVLIIASYSFIWLITGATDILTNTALVLIGIGAGTALGGFPAHGRRGVGENAGLPRITRRPV